MRLVLGFAILTVNGGKSAAQKINLDFPSLTAVYGGHLDCVSAGFFIIDIDGSFTYRLTVDENIGIGVGGDLDTGFFGEGVEIAAGKKNGKNKDGN